MKCKKCGSELPKGAAFCYECGTKVHGKGRASQPVLVWTRKKLIIASAIAAAVLIALIIPLAHYQAESQNRVETVDVPEGQYTITLTGTFIIGEDEVLPPGIYTICPAQGRKEFRVEISGEDNYWDYLYRDKYNDKNVVGYQLKPGYRVEIGNDGASFTKTSDIPVKASPSEPSGTQPVSEDAPGDSGAEDGPGTQGTDTPKEEQ